MITDLIHTRLAEIYTPEELRTLTHWIIEHVCGLTLAQQMAGKSMQMEEGQKAAITRIISRLEQHEPIQYVLGECSFHGLTFRVDRSVLIPRPETGELVERIVTNHQSEAGLRVLDIGTGSGCIAITLARKLHKPYVTALDISAEAIATARGNAHRNDAKVHFICADLFTPNLSLPAPFDFIVSNPPYVCRQAWRPTCSAMSPTRRSSSPTKTRCASTDVQPPVPSAGSSPVDGSISRSTPH